MDPRVFEELLATLKRRFEENMQRHPGIPWQDVEARLKARPEKVQSLYAMERTGGEPDVIGYDEAAGAFVFCDCAPQSPAGRRSLCYDREAREGRKKHPPAGSAVEMAETICCPATLPEFQPTLYPSGASWSSSSALTF